MKKLLFVFLIICSQKAFAYDSYIVFGAGTSDYNGVYTYCSDYGGKPAYRLGETGNYMYYSGGWHITNGLPSMWPIYRNSSSSNTPPATGWTVGMALSPAPTVVLAVPQLLFYNSLFVESSANDGTISNTLKVEYLVNGADSFSGENGIFSPGKYVATNVPSGLTVSITKKSATELTVSLTGTATSHLDANDLTNLQIAFLNAAFTNNDASAVANSTKSDIGVDFIQVWTVAASGGDFTTIAAAIAAADENDIIWVRAGTYTEYGITINKNLTIQGEGAANTIVQAHVNKNVAPGRVFLVNNGDYDTLINVTIKNITIKNGNQQEESSGGGGILNSENLTLENVSILDNTVVIMSQAEGGGIYSASGSTLIMNNCTLAGNEAKATAPEAASVNGGAIWTQGTLEMTNCTLTGNLATSILANSGGAIFLYSATSTLTNCTLKNNSATTGAGVSASSATLTILNTIIVDNGTSDYHVNSGITLQDKGYNLIGNQTSEWDPTDWYFNQTSDILYSHNYSGIAKGSWNRNDAAIVGDLNLSSTLEDNNTVFGTQTLKTTSGSFAIGAGASSVESYPVIIPQTDQRGALKDGAFDIGAYQYNINTAQADNVWTGKIDNLWGTAGNWTKNSIPTGTENLVIPVLATMPSVNKAQGDPALCNNITITKGSNLIVAAGKALTVNGNLVNNNTGSDGLTIKSDNSGTGSLKILGTVSAGATVEQYMTANVWHLISSPTATQPIINFLTDNKDIATSAASTPYSFAMRDYNTLEDKWSTSFFTDTKPEADLFGVGRGYAVLTKAPLTQAFSFKGALNTRPIPAVSVTTGWNLVGNPCTTALDINVGTNSFLSVNSGILPASFAAVYFWDSAISSYIAVNNDYADTYAPVGQGFIVRAIGSGNITFNSNMQVHNGSPGFKASALPRPTIKLMANSGTGSTSTLIKFMDGASEGLDVGYDAGIFKANPEFSVYTKLVEDNGVEFQLQYLPTNHLKDMVIPVGFDSKAAGEIVFSVETVQLAKDCKVILEDKLTNTFTNLSNESYKVEVPANMVGTGRFFLHTADIVSGLEDQVQTGKVTAYAKGNTEIRVIGSVGDNTEATLYDALGRVVLFKTLGGGNLNIIGLPNIKSGLYLLNVKDKGTSQTIKVMVRE